MDAVGVVVGIVNKWEKFLVERRRWDETIDPGIVCLPTGQVEPDESLEEALKRKMMDELGIKVNGFKFVRKNFYEASNGEKTACLMLPYHGLRRNTCLQGSPGDFLGKQNRKTELR
ncbi:MAG: NUDIX domain-containing protein, partial [Candidatus Bathyarchaeota archaeon]|nr:NUDIX domain-containing protein [Candidatus Bathyarchaeum sp.]